MDNEAIQALKDASEKEFSATYVADSQQGFVVCARTISMAIYSVTETLHEILNKLEAIDSSLDTANIQLQRIEISIDAKRAF